MEEFLKRLMELRGKDELSEEEQNELTRLERKLEDALENEDGNDGDEKRGYTDQDLENALERIMTNKSDDDDDKDNDKKRNINADTDIQVGDDRAPDWMRRTVRYFNALAMRKEDSVKADEMMQSLKRDVKQMNDRQRRDEHKEAADIIDSSGLSRIKRHALKSSLDIDERLQTTSTTNTAKTGYLLPKPFLAEVFVIVEQYGVCRQLFRTVPMTNKSVDLKNVVSKVVAYWTSEGNNIDFSDLVLGEGQLEVSKLAGITSWTTELEEDMAISLLPLVQDLFGESIAEKEDKAGLLGDGSASFGGYTGLANLSGAQTVTFSSTETSASDLSEQYLRDARNKLSEARQQGAVWIMNRTVKDHIEQFESGGGDRIFQSNISGTGPDTLLGKPIELAEAMPTMTDVSADEPFIIFGNPSRTLMGMRRGLTADISREAILQNADDSIAFNAFQGDGALLRLTERVGFKTPAAYEDAFVTINTAAS
ncbi:phage major capsid protein [Fodinibius sp. SL11]|uniref:phage major capsid protein n=1 Tax=Fodinibius sp. SL11 TaxID=3425690 RepID=UPI003F884C3C